MNDNEQLLTVFISCFARKIARLYPSACADKDDYIQAGHLKLAEIKNSQYDVEDFSSYAITAISREMRNTAIDAMCAVSAPRHVKRNIPRIAKLLGQGCTEEEVCERLSLPHNAVMHLRGLMACEPISGQMNEPAGFSEPFSALDDMLSMDCLTQEDKDVIQSKIENEPTDLLWNRKKIWRQCCGLRPKLTRSGYGI